MTFNTGVALNTGVPLNTGVALNKWRKRFTWWLRLATASSFDYHPIARSHKPPVAGNGNGEYRNTLATHLDVLFHSACSYGCFWCVTLSPSKSSSLNIDHYNFVSFSLETLLVSICCAISLAAMIIPFQQRIQIDPNVWWHFGVALNSYSKSPWLQLRAK